MRNLQDFPTPPATSPVQQKFWQRRRQRQLLLKVQESVASIKVQTEIPPGLLELDSNSLMEINGFPGRATSANLADLYTSLVTDQKDFA